MGKRRLLAILCYVLDSEYISLKFLTLDDTTLVFLAAHALAPPSKPETVTSSIYMPNTAN